MTDYKTDLYEHAKRLLKESFEKGKTVDIKVCFEAKPYLYSESENIFLQEEEEETEKVG